MNLSLISMRKKKKKKHQSPWIRRQPFPFTVPPSYSVFYALSELNASYMLHSAQHKAVDLSFLCKRLM